MRVGCPVSTIFSLLLVALIVTGSSAQDVRPEAPPSRSSQARLKGYLLDTEARSVVELDLDPATILRTSAIRGEPEKMMTTPDGSKLIVLHRIPGKQTMRFGYHPTAKTTISVIDLGSFSVLSRLELGWGLKDTAIVRNGLPKAKFGLGDFYVTPDSRRLAVFCPGYKSNNPEETLPAELVVVDLTTAEVAARVNVERMNTRMLYASDGSMAVAFSPEEVQDNSTVPAELRFVDLNRAELLGKLALRLDANNAVLSPDGKQVYVWSKNANAIEVVGTASRTGEKLVGIGYLARAFVDEVGQRMLFLSQDSKSAQGRLDIVTSSEVTTLQVGSNPFLLKVSPDRQRLIVVGTDAATVIDFAALQSLAQVPLGEHSPDVFTKPTLSSEHTPTEVLLSPDATRAFAVFAGSSKLLILDLVNFKSLPEVTTGSAAAKVGAFVLGAVGDAVSPQRMLAERTGQAYVQQFNGLEPPDVLLQLRRDGKTVYALNTQTQDVTVVESETGKVLDHIGACPLAYGLTMFGSGKWLVIPCKLFVKVIETSTNKMTEKLNLQGLGLKGGRLNGFVVSPDESRAFVLSGGKLLVLDGTTGKVTKEMKNFKEATQLLLVEQTTKE